MLKKIYLVPESAISLSSSDGTGVASGTPTSPAPATAAAPLAAPPAIPDPTGFGFEIRGTLLAKLRSLEKEIDRISRDTTIPDDQKIALISNLQTALQRFQTQFRSGVPVVTASSAASGTPASLPSASIGPVGLVAGQSQPSGAAAPSFPIAPTASPASIATAVVDQASAVDQPALDWATMTPPPPKKRKKDHADDVAAPLHDRYGNKTGQASPRRLRSRQKRQEDPAWNIIPRSF